MELTQDIVRHLFSYADGVLYWKNPRGKKMKSGDPAGYIGGLGYMLVRLDGKMYKNHRVIYLMHYGTLPEYIDHIDGNPLNNHIENLRPCTLSQNQHNRKKSGITWHKRRKKWQVQLTVNSVYKYLGMYEDRELAELVAIEACNKYHGVYARQS